ncbi:hypothetical protein RchiOBHm_Chr5g0055291 [Rosa chinensis]|uniref:Uncharacterized protein n=1 Tax=Rosa chinensis TaxID=74649 RepID=A0A2P6QGC5_ROSCH|nr:hypothetical protein RchiOBHm_Chr5g0055291 [Rosa chinensis]
MGGYDPQQIQRLHISQTPSFSQLQFLLYNPLLVILSYVFLLQLWKFLAYNKHTPSS